MLKKQEELLDYIDKYEELIKTISCKFDYKQTIENGRIVLTNKRVKFIEIKDTIEDRKKYKEIMAKYIDYINNNYKIKSSINNIDIDDCFNKEVLQKGKMPLFFVYNLNGYLLGMCGFRKMVNYEYCGKIMQLHEISVRIFSFDDKSSVNGYGLISALTAFLYGLRNKNIMYAKTYPEIRDLVFHISTITGHCYEGKYLIKYPFLEEKCYCDITFSFDFLNHQKVDLSFL